MTEHLDFLVVGAGLSGIDAAYHLSKEFPERTYAVLEMRDAIGGTWDLFRYPGVRSDSDMYTLGYSFRPWDGEKAIADGDDILQYIRDTAAETGVDEHIRFHHRIISADWSTEEARWHVTAERTDTGETVEVTANFVFSCSGYYRYDKGHEPQWEGLDDFEGQIVHPQHWPEDLDYADKKVVVIGSGATAITLIPSMAEDAELVTMLQRSPTYIVSVPAKNLLATGLRKALPDRYSGEAVRWMFALITQGSYRASRMFPKQMSWLLRRGVKAQLPKDFDAEKHFTPHYDPWDQRLCVVPNGDLFKSIRKGKADVVTDHIDRFTPKGILLESGDELQADIVVTATGLEMLFAGGIEASIDGEAIDVPSKFVYKGMMLQDVPNMANAIGYTNASWTLKCDLTCDYVTRLLNHMRGTGMRQCTPVNSDPSVEEQSLLCLTSGYVTRAADRFPKAGNQFPWQVHQSYIKDRKATRGSELEDGSMQFSNPAPAKERASA
jgi:cation diffusion facilitator CzcD-associated flavoprotein CzcO